jgi:mannan endo-1,4-beta-mannosidase
VTVDQFPTSFVAVEGTDFTLDDGTFYASGADASSAYTVGLGHPHHDQLRPLMFDGLERIGATVYRLFIESAPVELGGPFPGEDNEKFFKRFDMAITEAKRRNIRVSIPIVSGGPHYDKHPVENVANHVPGYVSRADTATEIDDFYRNEECIELYKQWVKELLTHENHLTGVEYRNDPTIMMWELGNEIAWTEPWTRESQTLRPWIEEVGPYVKQLAPDQLLTTGVHGWPDGRNDFVEDHRPDSIDVCSLHYWVGPAHYDLPESEAEALLDQKIEDAHETLAKPLWFSEYNWGQPDSPDELSEAFLEKRNSKLRKWHNRLDAADVAGAAVHQVNPKEVVEELIGTTRESTTIYPYEDTGTVEELRRYARITREKSTSSAVPELPELEA